jgi:hypothetical protein
MHAETQEKSQPSDSIDPHERIPVRLRPRGRWRVRRRGRSPWPIGSSPTSTRARARTPRNRSSTETGLSGDTGSGGVGAVPSAPAVLAAGLLAPGNHENGRGLGSWSTRIHSPRRDARTIRGTVPIRNFPLSHDGLGVVGTGAPIEGRIGPGDPSAVELTGETRADVQSAHGRVPETAPNRPSLAA